MTDFDHTLTKAFFKDGTRADTSFKGIIEYRKTPKEVQEECGKLFDKYFKIERNPNVPLDEKMHHM